MNIEENKEEIVNQNDVKNVAEEAATSSEDTAQTTAGEEEAISSEEVTQTSEEEQQPKEEEEKTSPFKKVETWIIVAIIALPVLWWANKHFRKDAGQSPAATQQTDIATLFAVLEQKAAKAPTYENYLALGITYENNGRPYQAIGALNKAMEISPNNPVVYNNLGYAKILLREYDDAISDLKKAIQLDTSLQLAKNNLKWAVTEKDNLIKDVKKKEETPEKDRNAQFYMYLAMDYQVLKQYEKSVENNKKSIALDARNAVVHNNLGVVYMFQQKYNDAIAAFQKAIEVDPNFQLAKNNLKWAEDEKAAKK